MKSIVVNCRTDPYDVFIGRPSKYGNPFTHLPLKKTTAKYQVKTPEEAVERYLYWILDREDLLNSLHELKGKRLGCYCKPNKLCHGDVLVELIELIYGSDPQTKLNLK